jgi:hypothetical protein
VDRRAEYNGADGVNVGAHRIHARVLNHVRAWSESNPL